MNGPTSQGASRDRFIRAAKLGLAVLVFSLGFMRPAIWIAGYPPVPTDPIAAALALLWGLLVVTGRRRLRLHPIFWLLGLYALALAASVPGAISPVRSAVKLATELYLIGLPVLVFNLVDDEQDLRHLCLAWLAASAVVALVALVSLFLFFAAPASPFLALMRYRFGTLPPGPYPRFQLTFVNANMLCNYLTVSLMILLGARHKNWLARWPFRLLLAGIAIAALLTLSPGLGGILLALGLSFWLLRRHAAPVAARLSLGLGIAAAALFALAVALTPILYPGARFLIRLPGIVLAPSGRMLTWTDAARRFAAHPWLGGGIGSDAADVHFTDPSGNAQHLTDAHNVAMSLAAQCGIAGVAAMLLIVVGVLRLTRPLRLDGGSALRLALGIAWLDGLVYQGLSGSFEDSRHLWVLLGLFLAAARLERATPTPAA